MAADDDAPSRRPPGELRKGWTTGACAAAASRAAASALLTGRFPDPVEITLPRGERPRFALAERALNGDTASAAVVKDAGDDPDVTHGALIRATLTRGVAGSGLVFRAGEGVGTVTLPGLALAPGEPAINPAPRAMIREAIRGIDPNGLLADVVVTIAVPGGEKLAAKTMNARLGIRGGISILGTTGIVVPYSCAAWIHSIHRGIDVARALGLSHVAAATGSVSEAAAKARYALAEEALIDMGDFAGGTLKYLARHPIARLTIAGGFGKLAKLAQGELDLHSSQSQVDIAALARALADLGAPASLAAEARAQPSAGAILALARRIDIDLAGLIARRARDTALATLAGDIAVDVLVVDRDGAIIGVA